MSVAHADTTEAKEKETTRKGPGGPIPPVLVFSVGLAAAWWLDQRLHFEIDGAGTSVAQAVLGGVALAAGTALFFWGLATFLRARTGIMLQQDASHVVESGPFRFSRNPMYVGLAVGYFGLAVLFNAAWPIVLLPAVLTAVSIAVIAREERYLRARFGPTFDAYCERVPRWL